MVEVKLIPESRKLPAGEALTLTATVRGRSGGRTCATWYTWGLGTLSHLPTAGSPRQMEQFANDRGHEVYFDKEPSGRGPVWEFAATWDTTGVPPGKHRVSIYVYESKRDANEIITASLNGSLGEIADDETTVELSPAVEESLKVKMQRAETPPTDDQPLWTLIRKSTNALNFVKYDDFMSAMLCGRQEDEAGRAAFKAAAGSKEMRDRAAYRIRLPFPDVDAYRQLKVATEVFMMVNCEVEMGRNADFDVDGEEQSERNRLGRDLSGLKEAWKRFLRNGRIPYLDLIQRKLQGVSVVRKPTKKPCLDVDLEDSLECVGILHEKLTHPCLLELIWSYWHEEGMLVQTMNAISWRFQNRRGPGDRDPLAMVEIDPLRPLNNFLWGYIQDEQHRLSVVRRAYEYDHHYGLPLLGKVVPAVRGADSRPRFLEAFHHLLQICSIFFKEDDDTTVKADGFPVLNGLKAVHLLLTQGAHNQYGDLPWTARQEMLMQEWLLARPEFREFLPRRVMVDYPEKWMDSVETMKTLQGWTNASVLHFRDLGVFGEQILLGIRFGAWPSVIDPDQAANWARYWRPEIQGYIHAYHSVTGVDLPSRVDATPPAYLLQRRLGAQVAAAR